uniref:Guanine nucleotidebinding proteinlike 3 putative n=1 Tax=Albugo laibachii Nc14 TaxID=890382 RepID=F0WQH9_9STRA|nr:guanine nucleotidebinding proteinlike 3 putative [Albugo laibachii Nc14]|eukprot:CCA23588.1 guanine nucleotidebinding proteinlike 3 putative [Albugo laibachii Nc14]
MTDKKRNGHEKRSAGSTDSKEYTGKRNPPKSATSRDKAIKRCNSQKLCEKRNELKQWRHNQHRSGKPPQHSVVQLKSLEELVSNAQKSDEAFLSKQTHTTANSPAVLPVQAGVTRLYRKELNRVIHQSDVLLQVLDARDPNGCRCAALEEEIHSQPGKKLVLILNKIDLIPQSVVLRWLTFLRQLYPTVAFKASTQEQSHNLSQNRASGPGKGLNLEGSSQSRGAVGTDALMQLLKNYCRNLNIKTAITVGVIGYPNVGKSSIINSLKRSKAASVSSIAGHTKCLQQVQIDSKIKLLDCPGIVFDDSDTDRLLLRNCINPESVQDPMQAVQVLLEQCDPEQLARVYKLHTRDNNAAIFTKNSHEFLHLVARMFGKLGKGGVPDRQAAAKMVLQDWNRGKIPFYVQPPVSLSGIDPKDMLLETTVVSSMSEEFNMDAILNPRVVFLPAAGKDEKDVSMADVPQASDIVADAAEAKAGSCPTDAMRTIVSDSDDSQDESDNDAVDVRDDNVGINCERYDIAFDQFVRNSAQDGLFPLAPSLLKKRAKAWRKLKRKIARQTLSEPQESLFCQELEKLGCKIPHPAQIDSSRDITNGDS